MNFLARILAALAIAICLALPAVSGEGGETGGGSGVWVLPRASCLAAPSPVARLSSPTMAVGEITLNIDPELGPVVATLVDDMTGLPMALPVVGAQVRVPASVLNGLNHVSASLLIADSSHHGYVMRVRFVEGGVVFDIF